MPGMRACLLLLAAAAAQVADEEYPVYDHRLFAEVGRFMKGTFPVPDDVPLLELKRRDVAQPFNFTCMNRCHLKTDHINDVFDFGKVEEMPLHSSNAGFLPNTTYWINEDLHVGHVHYDIVLMQVLHTQKVDRVVVQRTICKDRLCAGLGVVESFWKAYFAALFESAGQPNVPVYVRWTNSDSDVKPLFFSARSPDLYNKTAIKQLPPALQQFKLPQLMCFDSVTRSGKKHQYGSRAQVSVRAVQRFKAAAYKMAFSPPLSLSLSPDPPYRILFSHRGPRATRHISNLEEVIRALHEAFPRPIFELRIMNNSLPSLDWQSQLTAMAESHVVITNHGAFEGEEPACVLSTCIREAANPHFAPLSLFLSQGNMVYMRNSSLLLEIFGHYGNNEIHTFHRLALTFGIFYSRLHPKGITDHHQPSFNLSAADMDKLINVTRGYFKTVPPLLRIHRPV